MGFDQRVGHFVHSDWHRSARTFFSQLLRCFCFPQRRWGGRRRDRGL